MKYNLKIRDSDGNILETLQELPDKGGKFPTVLMVPGFGMDLHEYGYFDQTSDVLVRNGFQTFRFSFEGTGKSEGDFIETTLDRQAQQLRDILSYVKKDRFVKGRRIGVLAQSFGTAAVVAGLPLKEIKAYLFTSAPPDPYPSLAKWFKRQLGFDPDGISEIERADKRKTRVGPFFWKSLNKHNLISEIQRLDKPILFIHGGSDDKIKYWEAQDYYNTVKSRKKFILIKKADHAFTGKFRPKVLELITQWFDETLS